MRNYRDVLRKKKRDKEKYLLKYGAYYNMGISSAEQFFAVKLAGAAVFMLIGLKLASLWAGAAMGIAGFFIPNILLKIMNDADNDAMFYDLKAIYDTLRIQQSAGVYITNALMDCYLLVKNKRLKAALKELSRNIVSEKDIAKAVSPLSDKFRNDYIDELVTIITQSLQTGQMTRILEEINKQMLNIEDIMNSRKENAIERKMTAIEILLYIGILAIALYGLAMSVSTSIYNF